MFPAPEEFHFRAGPSFVFSALFLWYLRPDEN
jgi:hypothetical protein